MTVFACYWLASMLLLSPAATISSQARIRVQLSNQNSFKSLNLIKFNSFLYCDSYPQRQPENKRYLTHENNLLTSYFSQGFEQCEQRASDAALGTKRIECRYHLTGEVSILLGTELFQSIP